MAIPSSVAEPSSAPIRIGVSSCLLGEEVRWDGGHQRVRFVTDVFGPFVEFVPVCPEVGSGLSVTGSPVLASAVGGINDQIVDGENGVLVDDPEDLDAFAEALGALIADPERAEHLAAAGAERARRQFLDSYSFRRQAEWFLGIMSDVLADRS